VRMETLIAVAPLFDDVTVYSIAWTKKAIKEIEGKIEIIEFLDERAVKEKVGRELDKTPKPEWFMHMDHGSEYVLWGDDEEPIIDLSNLDRLAGMHVYCLNCLSGKGLGAHAVGKGVLEYWGYLDSVAFTTDALEEFGDVFNYGIIVSVAEGRWLKDVVEEARQRGYDTADSLREEGKILAASAMVRDMNILHVYYEGGPEPPEPECRFSRLVKRLFGWNGLWLLRMLRQKLLGPARTRNL